MSANDSNRSATVEDLNKENQSLRPDLRVTVGTMEEMKRFVEELRAIVG